MDVSQAASAALSVWLQAPTRYRPTDADIETIAAHFDVDAGELQDEINARVKWPADQRKGELAHPWAAAKH